MNASQGSTQIRRYRTSDRPALYDICVRTAAARSDARGRWRSDDLMPSHHGRGHGRAMMSVLLAALAADGAAAVHVGVLTATAARGSYDRLGWYEIDLPDPGPPTYLGARTSGSL